MKSHMVWVVFGFCTLVLAAAAQKSGTNSTTRPHLAKFSGAASSSGVTLSPPSLNFGSVPYGITSPPMVVTLTNEGSLELNITSIRFTGADPGDFLQNHTCGSLAAGASCTISVRFRPAQTGPRKAELTVNDYPPTGRQETFVSGTGVPGLCRQKGENCANLPHYACCRGLTCVACGDRDCCR